MKFTTTIVLALTTTLFATTALARSCEECKASYAKHHCETKLGSHCGVVRACIEKKCLKSDVNYNLVWVGGRDGSLKDITKLSGAELAEAEIAQAREQEARSKERLENAARVKAQREKEAREKAELEKDYREHGPAWHARAEQEQRLREELEKSRKKEAQLAQAQRENEAREKEAAEKKAREEAARWKARQEQLAREKAQREQADRDRWQRVQAGKWQAQALDQTQECQEQFAAEEAADAQVETDLQTAWDENAAGTLR